MAGPTVSVSANTVAVSTTSAGVSVAVSPSVVQVSPAGSDVLLSLSTDTPIVDGTASAGSALRAARADHIHPIGDQVEGRAQLANAARLAQSDGDGTVSEAGILNGVSGAVLTLSATLTGDRALSLPDSDVTVSAFGASLIDDADASAARSTLGLGSIATQSAASVAITGGTISGVTSIGTGTLTATGKISTTSTASDSLTTAGGGVFGSDLTVARSINGVLQSIITNTSAGAAAISRVQIRNDLGDNCRIQMAAHSSAYSTTLFGINVANHVAIRGDGTNNAGMVIGNVGTNAPIIFGVNTAEVMRLTTAGAQVAGVLLVNATAPISTEKYYCNGDGRFAGSVTCAGIVGNSSGPMAFVAGSGGATSVVLCGGTTNSSAAGARVTSFAYDAAAVGGNLYLDGDANAASVSGSVIVRVGTGLSAAATFSRTRTTFAAIDVLVNRSTASTSTSTGALVVAGGVGIAGALNVGGTKVNMASLPTSASGLATGDLWNNGGVLNIA